MGNCNNELFARGDTGGITAPMYDDCALGTTDPVLDKWRVPRARSGPKSLRGVLWLF